MSAVPTNRGASGVAITSLVFGILTLMMIWLPILHLLPGVVAVALGIVAVQLARQGTAGGEQLAVVGMLFALIGMLPTITLALAVVIAGIRGAVQSFGQASLFEGGTVGTTLLILPWKSPENSEAYVVEAETYHINTDGQRSDIHGTFGLTSLEPGKSPLTAKHKRFGWKSTQTDLIRYHGVLHTFYGKRVALTVHLENKVPLQLAVEGLRDVAVSQDEQAISLDQPLPPGTRTIRITGVVR